MKALRSVVAVAVGAGFLMSAAVVGGGLVTAVGRIMVAGFGALMGGWVAARLAPFAPFGHAAALAAIVGTATVSMMAGGPAAGRFTATAGAVAVAGTIIGGALRAAAVEARKNLTTKEPS